MADTPAQVRLHKSVVIARSGVHLYTRAEVQSMIGDSIPKGFENKKLFGVYRPATLLAANKDKFASQPLLNTHKGFVNPENFSKWAQGWVGDSVEVEMNEDKTEAVIKADLHILGQEAIDAYEDGTRQVSPHHFGQYDWDPGVAPDGTEFQVVQRDLSMVNHLALVPRGRGGPDAAIQDAAPGPFTRIWDWITGKSKKGEAKDEATFRQQLEEIASLRATLTDTDLETKLGPLYKCIDKMPWDEDKDLLYRFMADARLLLEDRSDEEAAEYVKIVADLYEKVDSKTLGEIMSAQEKEIKGQEDAMADEKEKKDTDPDKDRDQELEGFMAKVKDHIAKGGKVSDFKVAASDEEPEKKDDKKEEKAEAKDEKEDKGEKDEDEKKEKEGEKDSAPSILGQYDAAPFNMGLSFGQRPAQSDAGNNLLRQVGFLPKEKK